MSTVESEAAEAASSEGVSEKLKTFKERHHLEFEISFFFAGFLFDVLLLHRIDSKPLLAHQGLYLLLSAGLIFWDHKLSVAEAQPTGVVGKLASYRLWAMHFFLGTLLNAFMVFYFRAASGLLAFLFLVALAAIIVLNELPQFRSRGPIVRVLLLSFSVTSYLAYLLPVLVGALRSWQYIVAVAVGSLATFGLWKLFTTFTRDPNWTFRRAVLPGLVLQGALLVLYLVGMIPPVPLSLKHIGIYSNVTPHREQGLHYTLEFQPAPKWKVWRREDPTFIAPAGSKAWAFVKIFAPAKFEDRIGFAWEFDDPKNGWTERGKPFFTLLQGLSEDGYHTFAYSTLGKPGDYRVRVVTEDGREIGRKSFTFVEGEAPTPTIEEE